MTENIAQRRQISLRRVLELILVCMIGIAVNLLLSSMSTKLQLPFYLDSVGTIFAAAVGGTLPGVLVGLVTNLLKSISDLPSIYYGTLNVMIAVAVASFTWDRSKKRILVPLIFTLAFIGGVLGSILTWVLFGFAGEA